MQADIGLIGLAVMGQNLVLNMADHGFSVAVFNRTTSKIDEFLQGPAKGKTIVGARDLGAFIQLLKRPRRVMLMVKAGAPVDEWIKQIVPLLEKGDVIIDGGNSFYVDSERRVHDLKEKGIHFLGVGISGGEEGARNGPAIMPGGSKEAWLSIEPIFQAIAARSEEWGICCKWVGDGGAGHYVKMVHNGIEYGDMQIICEAYDLLYRGLSLSPRKIARLFKEWNGGVLNSYLMEITAEILRTKDEDGSPLLEHILDAAGQKGTGKWTVNSALDLGMPVTLIGEAVFMRCLSAMKEERVEASCAYPIARPPVRGKRKLVQQIADALYAAKITSYAQGFLLLRRASEEYGWNLAFDSIALIWRGGCIIRSRFLGQIYEAFHKNPRLASLFVDPFFAGELMNRHAAWRSLVAEATLLGIPMSCMGSALSFFDGYRSERLPANLLQAQRDFFGAHTYERTDRPRGEFFHTNWTGRGGDARSSQYTA